MIHAEEQTGTSESTTRPWTGHFGQARDYPAPADPLEQIINEPINLRQTLFEHTQATALELIDELGLPPGSTILELGKGSAALTTALARRGYRVTTMVRMKARQRSLQVMARRTRLSDNIQPALGNPQNLQFVDHSFDLVLALGVVSWLDSPAHTMEEIKRVLRTGGCAILSFENKWCLNGLLDPRTNAVALALGKWIRNIVESLNFAGSHFHGSLPRRYSSTECDVLFRKTGLEKLAGFTIAFGPFTIMGRRILPDLLGKFVHRTLQRLADTGIPLLRFAGAQHVFVGRRL